MTKLSLGFHIEFILRWFTGGNEVQAWRNSMKIKSIIGVALVAGLAAGCMTEKHQSKEGKEAKQAKLMAKAKVSKEDAEKTALAQVPNGMVKEAELEKEKGKLIWSFDIATPGSK